MIYFIFGAVTLAFILALIYIYTLKRNERRYAKALSDEKEYSAKILSQKKSSEIRTGQITEQLAPFLDNFKYDPKRLHFIGMPIDYICFNDDEIIIIEVKSGNSQLTPVQKNIKSLIDQKKIRWETFRVK